MYSNGNEQDIIALVHRLLAASLAAWQVVGRVDRDEDRITLTAGQTTLLVARGSSPFRWTVTLDGRKRGVTSIAGLLRVVRRVVDPDHQGSRLRIAPSPLVPPI
ncbi:MAG TPA: hypothetical protein VGZ49_09045 [Xanthobacteraceae bacterium]|jgi:hypothetical protein|nr:hypothetical protein [Xanthobacteraceae bacterium]